jgi:hypothetical protein
MLFSEMHHVVDKDARQSASKLAHSKTGQRANPGALECAD